MDEVGETPPEIVAQNMDVAVKKEKGVSNSLSSFTSDELRAGTKLQDKISSISHDVESGDKSKMDLVLKQAVEVSNAVSKATDNKLVMLGSMGMYLTLSEIRQGGEQFTLVDQRIGRGKNDYDIGVHPEELSDTMSDFEWDKQAQKLQRGKVGHNHQMVDLLSRRELPHFPWRDVQVEGETIVIQGPEEMIFERMSALIEPQVDDDGKPKEREGKWAVDIKLVKTYLREKNGWTENQIEEHLANKWNNYVEDTRYQGVIELIEQAREGIPVPEIIEEAVKKRLGKDKVTDVRQELVDLFGAESEVEVEALLSSSAPDDFENAAKTLIDKISGEKLIYEEASQKASEEYIKIKK